MNTENKLCICGVINRAIKLILIIFTLTVIPTSYAANETTVLSRQKRYLIFPEGSSLQLGKELEKKM